MSLIWKQFLDKGFCVLFNILVETFASLRSNLFVPFVMSAILSPWLQVKYEKKLVWEDV